MSDGIQMQLECGNRVHGDTTEGIWDYHFTSDPLIRYLRDRRLYRALKELDKRGKLDPSNAVGAACVRWCWWRRSLPHQSGLC